MKSIKNGLCEEFTERKITVLSFKGWGRSSPDGEEILARLNFVLKTGNTHNKVECKNAC